MIKIHFLRISFCGRYKSIITICIYNYYLEKNGIETRTLFSSIPTQCKGYEYIGYKLGDFPNAEYIGKNAIHIGCHQDLEISDIQYVLDIINDFLVEKKLF